MGEKDISDKRNNNMFKGSEEGVASLRKGTHERIAWWVDVRIKQEREAGYDQVEF